MVNKVILIGNVGVDPEVRTLESGAKVARVRLATTERLFDRQANETKEHTEWHTITLWRGLADVVDRYVNKGSQIYIEGRLRTREWTDKDNNKRYTTEILADDMKLLGRRGDNQSAGAPAGGSASRRDSRPISNRRSLRISSSLWPRLPLRLLRTIRTICRSDFPYVSIEYPSDRFFLSGGFFFGSIWGMDGILSFGSRVCVRRLSDNIWVKGIVGRGQVGEYFSWQ